jgi:hypothetical protein
MWIAAQIDKPASGEGKMVRCAAGSTLKGVQAGNKIAPFFFPKSNQLPARSSVLAPLLALKMAYNSLGGDPSGGYQSGIPAQSAYNPDFSGASAYGAYGGAYAGAPQQQQQQQLQPPQVRGLYVFCRDCARLLSREVS